MSKKEQESVSTKQILQLQDESDALARRSPRITRKSLNPVVDKAQIQTPDSKGAKRIRLSREFKGLSAQSTKDISLVKLDSSEKIVSNQDTECKLKDSDLKLEISSDKLEKNSWYDSTNQNKNISPLKVKVTEESQVCSAKIKLSKVENSEKDEMNDKKQNTKFKLNEIQIIQINREKSKPNSSCPNLNLNHKAKLSDKGKESSESIKADKLPSSNATLGKLNKTTTSKIININDPDLDLSTMLLNLCAGDKSLSEGMKSLPGMSYILIFTRAKRRENFITFDCVICNPSAGRILSGSVLTKHLRSRSHLLNILKIHNYSLYEEHKNSPETTLLKICNTFKSVGSKDGVVFVAADTYRGKRSEISQTVTQQLERSKKIEEDSKVASDILELAALESEIFDTTEDFEFEDTSENMNFNTFDKAVLITIPEYSVYVEKFKSLKVSVICVTSGSLNNVAAAIRCRKKFEPKRTLWLTHPEVFRISQTESSELCSTCEKPLEIHVLPSTYKTAHSAYVTEIQAEFDTLVKNVNSFLGSDSKFAILPPFPPAFLPLKQTEHDQYHKSDKGRRNYSFISSLSLIEFKSLYAEFSKQMISFSLSEFKNLNLASHHIGKYMPVVRSWNSYLLVVTFQDVLQHSEEFVNEKYDEWFKYINKFITDSIAPLVDENLKSPSKEDNAEPKLLNEKAKNVAENVAESKTADKADKKEPKSHEKAGNVASESVVESSDEEHDEFEEIGENLSDILSDILGDIANGGESESDVTMLDSSAAFSKNEESHINSENYDQIVFICFCKAHAQLVPRDEKNAKNVSVVTVNSSLEWLEEKEKFNAVISRDFKTVLFIVMGSITLLGKENKESFCGRLKCTEPLFSVDLGSGGHKETVNAVIQKYKKFMFNLRTYLNMLFTHFILIPMLPVKCAPQNLVTNNSSHDYFHKVLKNTNITFLTGGKDRWTSFAHNFRNSGYTEMLKQGHGMLYEEDIFNSILKEIKETSKPPICWVKLSQNAASVSSDYNEEEYKLFLKSFINMSCLDDKDEGKHLKGSAQDSLTQADTDASSAKTGRKRKRGKSNTTNIAAVADSVNESSEQKDALTSALGTSKGAIAENICLKILLPPYATTAVIGLQGRTIAKIRNDSKAIIKFSTAREYYPGTTEQIGALSGPIDVVLAALTLIMNIKEKADRTQGFDENPDKKVQIKFAVSDVDAARIIGKRGAHINRIKAESKALVQVCPKPANFSLKETCFTISSSDVNNCKTAFSKILIVVATEPSNVIGTSTPSVNFSERNVVKQDSRISSIKKGDTLSKSTTSLSASESTKAGDICFKILLPSYVITAAIGLNGKTISKLRSDTKAVIMFSKAREYYPMTTEQIGSLSGTEVAVLAALTSIMSIKEEADRTQSSDNVSGDKKVQIKFVVSDVNAARIIGKRGTRINRIKTESKALLQVCPKPVNFPLQETCFTMSSNDINNCKAAFSMILSLVATDPPNMQTTNVAYSATNQDNRNASIMSSSESYSTWSRQNYEPSYYYGGSSQQNYRYPAAYDQTYNGYSTNSSHVAGGYRPSISQVAGEYSSSYRASIKPLVEVTGHYFRENPSISQVLGEYSSTDNQMGSSYSQDTRYQPSYQTQSSHQDNLSSTLRGRLSPSWRSRSISPRQRSPYSSQKRLLSARGEDHGPYSSPKRLRTRSRSRSGNYRAARGRKPYSRSRSRSYNRVDNRSGERDTEYQPRQENQSKKDAKASAIDSNFSLIGALNLLQRVCGKCGAMGRMTKDLAENIKSELEKDRSKALKMIQQEDNNILFKMVVDKLKVLIPSAPLDEMTLLSKAVEWTSRLAEYTDKPKDRERKLNLKAIAKASLNKTPDFTVSLIKSAFKYEGKSNPTAEEISETYLEVSSLQCELMLESK